MTVMLGTGGMTMWLILLGMLVLFWLMSRGQVKAMKEQQASAKAVVEGDRVILQSGLFGTLKHMGERQIIVELAPGVEVACMRQAILRRANAEDDEFEFEDIPADIMTEAFDDVEAAPLVVEAAEPKSGE